MITKNLLSTHSTGYCNKQAFVDSTIRFLISHMTDKHYNTCDMRNMAQEPSRLWFASFCWMSFARRSALTVVVSSTNSVSTNNPPTQCRWTCSTQCLSQRKIDGGGSSSNAFPSISTAGIRAAPACTGTTAHSTLGSFGTSCQLQHYDANFTKMYVSLPTTIVLFLLGHFQPRPGIDPISLWPWMKAFNKFH